MRNATHAFRCLSTVCNVRIGAFMVRVAHRITYRTLSIRRGRRITYVRPLRKSFVARPRFLCIGSEHFLLRYLLGVAVSNVCRYFTTGCLYHGQERLSKANYA